MKNLNIFNKYYYNKYSFFFKNGYHHQEYQYLDLLKKVIQKGELYKGRNGNTLALFGEKMEFDIGN